jgi:NAD(P)H dehydrogenase (quinone)
MSLVITGASGQLARLTANHVARTVSPSDVTLVTRTPDALGDFADRGFVVRYGDFDDPASLRSAFRGGERLLVVSTLVLGTRVPQHRAAIGAAVAAGIGHAAYTGGINPSDSNPSVAHREHRATEEALRASGMAWTALRNGIYAEGLLQRAPAALATGKLISNAGGGRNGYVAREDCAAAAAAVLTGEGHEGREYDITGPEALSEHDVAALLSELGGAPVEPVLLDDEEWVATMVEHAGMPEPLAQTIATFGMAARRGYAAVVSTAVQDLTGRPPKTVREVLEPALSR